MEKWDDPPGVGTGMGKLYFYQNKGRSHGPFTSSELRELAAAGELKGDDLIRTQDTQQWKQAYKIKNLFEMEKGPPPSQACLAPLPEIPASIRTPVPESRSVLSPVLRPYGSPPRSHPPGLPSSGLQALAERAAAYFNLPLFPFLVGVVGAIGLLLIVIVMLFKLSSP
jgi:hypothetical protein